MGIDGGKQFRACCQQAWFVMPDYTSWSVRPEAVKIDRAFIADLEHNHHSMAIVRAVIGLAHSLKIPVLAEGVEQQSQRAFLMQEGCDQIQGYLAGRPFPIGDYADLVGRDAGYGAARLISYG